MPSADQKIKKKFDMVLRKKRLCTPGLNLSCVPIGPWCAVPYDFGR